jgi:hypothetical protein
MALGPLGAPTMLLTTTGAVTGQTRTTPLLSARDDDDILVEVVPVNAEYRNRTDRAIRVFRQREQTSD